MKIRQGTWSVLFGCHSTIHSVVVLVAWHRWYGRWPTWWQVGCILLHDIGHWSKDYLNDYEAKKRHADLGAQVAGKLFGEKGYDLVMGHNLYKGQGQSALFFPDKYSWVIAPVWWMITNTWFEPKLVRPGNTRKESALMFKSAMRANMVGGFREQGHDIYLKQWQRSQKA